MILRNVTLSDLQVAIFKCQYDIETSLSRPLSFINKVFLPLLQVSILGILTDHIEQDLSINALVHATLYLLADRSDVMPSYRVVKHGLVDFAQDLFLIKLHHLQC